MNIAPFKWVASLENFVEQFILSRFLFVSDIVFELSYSFRIDFTTTHTRNCDHFIINTALQQKKYWAVLILERQRIS